MNQKKANIVAVQQAEFGDMKNVLSDVTIRNDLQQYWFDALSQFAGSMRVMKGLNTVIRIEKEIGYVNELGHLVVVAGVAGERLEMEFPSGTWNWKSDVVGKPF